MARNGDEEPNQIEYPPLGSSIADAPLLPPPEPIIAFARYQPIEPEDRARRRTEIDSIAEEKRPLSVAFDVAVALQGHPVVLRAMASVIVLLAVLSSPLWLFSAELRPALANAGEHYAIAVHAPAIAAIVGAAAIFIARLKHRRYEALHLALCAVSSMTALLAVSGRSVSAAWAALLMLLPIAASVWIIADQDWLTMRRRYRRVLSLTIASGAAAFALLFFARSLLGDRRQAWDAFAERAESCTDLGGFDPMTAALFTDGSGHLGGQLARCAISELTRAEPMASAEQAPGDELGYDWLSNTANRARADRRAELTRKISEVTKLVSSLPETDRSIYAERLESERKRSNHVCENPFREPEAALWRAAGIASCGADPSWSTNEWIYRAIGWLAPLTDPNAMIPDLGRLLEERAHSAGTSQVSTADVTLLRPRENGYQRGLILRVLPAEKVEPVDPRLPQKGRELYLIAYPEQGQAEPLAKEIRREMIDRWKLAKPVGKREASGGCLLALGKGSVYPQQEGSGALLAIKVPSRGSHLKLQLAYLDPNPCAKGR